MRSATEDTDMLRQEFEEEVYQRYFDRQTQDLALAPDTLPMSQYIAKNEEGDYIREDVAMAWWGFCQHAQLQETRIATEAKETECPLCRYSGNWMLHFNDDGRKFELRGLLVRLGGMMP